MDKRGAHAGNDALLITSLSGLPFEVVIPLNVRRRLRTPRPPLGVDGRSSLGKVVELEAIPVD